MGYFNRVILMGTVSRLTYGNIWGIRILILEPVSDVVSKRHAHYALGSTRIGDKIQAWIEQADTHEKVSRVLGASGKMEYKNGEPVTETQ